MSLSDGTSHAIESLQEADRAWRESSALTFGSTTWTPHLVREDDPGVLHVHTAERLRPYVAERMKAAAQAGYIVHVASARSALYDPEFLTACGYVGCVLHLMDDRAEPDGGRDILKVLMQEQIRVQQDVRMALCQPAMTACLAPATAFAKGRRFEGLLAFLFSQVEGLRVVECNYRTETEELDLVLQLTEAGGERCWSRMSQPLIVVEAKNWSNPVPQEVVTTLYGKIHPKSNVANTAFLGGMNGFTGDADKQVLRYSGAGVTIVQLDRTKIEEWIVSEDPTDFLDRLTRRAMLA